MTGKELREEINKRIEANKINWCSSYSGYSGETTINRKKLSIYVWEYQSGTQALYQDHIWEPESEPVYSIDARVSFDGKSITIPNTGYWFSYARDYVSAKREKAERAEERRKEAAERRAINKEQRKRERELNDFAKDI